MKFTAKNTNYIAQGNNGLFPNAFVEDDVKLVNGSQYLRIDFPLFYQINTSTSVVKTKFKGVLEFNEVHTPMYVLNENDEPVELLTFLHSGGKYDKTKVYDWGHPSAQAVRNYFNLDSIWDKLIFKEQSLKQVAIDWVEHVLKVDGLPITENFEYTEQWQEL